jgi:hypothetical protein
VSARRAGHEQSRIRVCLSDFSDHSDGKFDILTACDSGWEEENRLRPPQVQPVKDPASERLEFHEASEGDARRNDLDEIRRGTKQICQALPSVLRYSHVSDAPPEGAKEVPGVSGMQLRLVQPVVPGEIVAPGDLRGFVLFVQAMQCSSQRQVFMKRVNVMNDRSVCLDEEWGKHLCQRITYPIEILIHNPLCQLFPNTQNLRVARVDRWQDENADARLKFFPSTSQDGHLPASRSEELAVMENGAFDSTDDGWSCEMEDDDSFRHELMAVCFLRRLPRNLPIEIGILVERVFHSFYDPSPGFIA